MQARGGATAGVAQTMTTRTARCAALGQHQIEQRGVHPSRMCRIGAAVQPGATAPVVALQNGLRRQRDDAGGPQRTQIAQPVPQLVGTDDEVHGHQILAPRERQDRR